MIGVLIRISFRSWCWLISVISLLLLGYAYWLEYFQNLDPCPLCIFQRVIYVGLFILGVTSALHNPPRGLVRYIYGFLGGIFSFIGILISGRHVWLQSLPSDRVPECGPGLDYLIEMFSFSEMLRKVLTGSGECATVDWKFLNLSMPAWALIWFFLLGILFVFANLFF